MMGPGVKPSYAGIDIKLAPDGSNSDSESGLETIATKSVGCLGVQSIDRYQSNTGTFLDLKRRLVAGVPTPT
jgi:hypothetical protein